MSTLPTIHDIDARQVLPGDTLLRHPDIPNRQGEWAITSVRRADLGASVRLDYVTGDAAGCFVIAETTRVTVRNGAPGGWLADLTHAERDHMLLWLSGYDPAALAAALSSVTRSRDHLSDFRLRHTEEANAA